MSVPKAVRIVIYPLFEADAEATEALLEALADALVDAHGEAEVDDDSVRSIIVVEETDEDIGSEEWTVALARRGDIRCIVLPGAAEEDA